MLKRWPSYATYVVSFLTIGIIWANHHAVMERIKNVDRPLLGLAFGLIWAYAVLSDDLLHDKIDPDRARRSLLMFAAGNRLYVLAIGVSFLSTELALAIYALLALFYLFDVLPPLQERPGKQG